ncbi:hypothetical protein N7474_003182 [Penicillium riverlandense]|uniref:uncharacterized protein n=1 Tax=Penicillium riverlandense TaxID=1903569 RepID=UPI0025493DAB|nr:uncharacterized protein N7474_003182 [Penicillium riverlandense]KAJ5826044.1 hypothetical protein N7474_003182 [Penicillium riverlandense]
MVRLSCLLLLLSSTGLPSARPTESSLQGADDSSFSDFSFPPASSNAIGALNSPLISRGRLYPRIGRNDNFMKHFVKGAKLWDKFQHDLQDHTGAAPKPISLVYDDHTEGWEGEGDCAVRVPVPGKDGWRFERQEVEESVQLSTVFQEIGLDGQVQLEGLYATLWKDPEIVVSIYFDCANGIMVRYLAYLRYHENGQSHDTDDHWSDVSWALYEKACPTSLQELQYVIVTLVKNPVTKVILEDATAAAGHWNKKNAKENNFVLTTWEPSRLTTPISTSSCSPESRDCDFFALLHTPNAVGVLYLLRDHMLQLNFKSIKSISGFHDCIYQNAEGSAFVKWTMFMKLT